MYELFEKAVKETDRKVKDINVLILGYAYDANSDDDRNTPTEPLMAKLTENNVNFDVHDPYIDEYKGELEVMLDGKDAVILVTGHDEYKGLDYKKMAKVMNDNPIIIDGRNIFDKEEAREKGFVYKGVGNV
jgi:UDP-N-acetyl-D-mannosaminuronate dehydrogenase